jgi:phosphoribosylaminoimidazole (AIR) synthetase
MAFSVIKSSTNFNKNFINYIINRKLSPTRIFVENVLALVKQFKIIAAICNRENAL